MDPATVAAISGAIGAGLGTASQLLYKVFVTKHEQNVEVHKDTVQEYKELTNRLEKTLDQTNAEVKQHRDKIDKLQRDHAQCEALNAKMVERISYFEELLEDKGIKFRPWDQNKSNPSIDTVKGNS